MRDLGHYRLLEQIGAGGMGVVYRARDERLGRQVAIKVLPEAFARDPERLARFEREAQVLASLNHPNIAAIYGLEEHAGERFLVLELAPGPTLGEHQAGRALDPAEALAIAAQIAEALEDAHGKGIVHRDLKPANVKVTPEGKVKVLDFGLAKVFRPDPGEDPSGSPTVTIGPTRDGVILGTVAYMSPEQARAKPLDKRSDIWSFGCVLYEIRSVCPRRLSSPYPSLLLHLPAARVRHGREKTHPAKQQRYQSHCGTSSCPCAQRQGRRPLLRHLSG